jgi:hypothetical protein
MDKRDTKAIVAAQDIPMESPSKYGKFDDNAVDDLADALNGREPRKRSDPHNGFGISHTDVVDEDFMREARNPKSHYGE